MQSATRALPSFPGPTKSTKLKQCYLKGLPLKVLYLSTSMAYSVSATDSPSTSPHRTML